MHTKQAVLRAHGRMGKPNGRSYAPGFRWRIVRCGRTRTGDVCHIKAKRDGRHKPWFATVPGEALQQIATGVLVTLRRAASGRHDPGVT